MSTQRHYNYNRQNSKHSSPHRQNNKPNGSSPYKNSNQYNRQNSTGQQNKFNRGRTQFQFSEARETHDADLVELPAECFPNLMSETEIIENLLKWSKFDKVALIGWGCTISSFLYPIL